MRDEHHIELYGRRGYLYLTDRPIYRSQDKDIHESGNSPMTSQGVLTGEILCGLPSIDASGPVTSTVLSMSMIFTRTADYLNAFAGWTNFESKGLAI